MLLWNLSQKSVSIPTAELPSVILDQPIVQIAWKLRNAAQRNYDTQKEGSKGNAERGINFIARYVQLLKASDVPFLLACIGEIRLREMRRSALRALTKTYNSLKGKPPIRTNETGEVVERRMMLLSTLHRVIGCDEQEQEESAWDDVFPIGNSQDEEAIKVAERFDLEVYEDETGPVGVLLNASASFNGKNQLLRHSHH